jgi:DNA-binding Xre family transcriptional regulator
MKLKNNVRLLIVRAGYKSLLEFAEEHNISYYLLRKLANNELNSIDIHFLVSLCKALNCDVSDLLYIDKVS